LTGDPFLRGPGPTITSVSFGPDNRRIVASSTDGSVRTFECDVCGSYKYVLRLARRLDAALRR
jgi:hypothetical protein